MTLTLADAECCASNATAWRESLAVTSSNALMLRLRAPRRRWWHRRAGRAGRFAPGGLSRDAGQLRSKIPCPPAPGNRPAARRNAPQDCLQPQKRAIVADRLGGHGSECFFSTPCSRIELALGMAAPTGTEGRAWLRTRGEYLWPES